MHGSVFTLVAVAFAMLSVTFEASAQILGTPEGDKIENRSLQNAVRNDALRRAHGGSRGGCAQLPAGWAAFDVTVNFPKAYAGYPAWVNSAELLPGNADVKGYVAGANPPGVLMRPALRAGSMAVRSHLCAPAGRRYWLIVDSGMARVAVGRIDVGAAPGPYQFNLAAPPLGSGSESTQAGESVRGVDAASQSTSGNPPPSSSGDYASPTAGPGYVPPSPSGGFRPPTVGPGFVPPGSASSNPP